MGKRLLVGDIAEVVSYQLNQKSRVIGLRGKVVQRRPSGFIVIEFPEPFGGEKRLGFLEEELKFVSRQERDQG